MDRFVDVVTTVILPRHRGALVKSPGRCLMARFETVPDAVDAAAEIHRTLDAQKQVSRKINNFHLRAGVNAAMAWSDGLDIYGTGVNWQQRLATLAGRRDDRQRVRAMSNWRPPWPAWRDPAKPSAAPQHATELTHGVDASCEDLGECILKHFDKRCALTALARQVRTPQPHGRRSLWIGPLQADHCRNPFLREERHPCRLIDVGNLIAG
jgi:class 3 adenylate cyclase